MNQWLTKGHENLSPSPYSPPVKGGKVPYLPSPLAGEGKGEGGFSGQKKAKEGGEEAVLLSSLIVKSIDMTLVLF